MTENILIIPNIGFINTGSICYFNSLVQSLLSCKSFLDFICKEKQDSIFFYFFKLIFIDKQWDPFFTSKLLNNIGDYQGNQSSSEYFLKICDFFNLDELFKTRTETKTICKKCAKENNTIDTSLYFLINNEINEFFETKREVENFNCDNCKEKVNVLIISNIKEIRNIIVFSFNKYFEKKIIYYPREIIINDRKYFLISTIEHHGNLDGGHYYCRTMRNNSLLKIDDINISEIENLEPTENTYMIFYELFQEK